MDRFATYLFDLDGTLIDSLADLGSALNRLRADFQLSPLPLEEIRLKVGDGARKLVERSLLEDQFDDSAVQQFLTYYGQNLLGETRPYPMITELLQHLHQHGAKLGVVTNKPIAMTRPILQGLELTPLFEVILGGDSVANKKPAPDMILEAINTVQSSPEQTLVIGDHHTDLHAGQRAGAATCFCRWGFGHDDGLTCDYQVDSSSALHDLLVSRG